MKIAFKFIKIIIVVLFLNQYNMAFCEAPNNNPAYIACAQQCSQAWCQELLCSPPGVSCYGNCSYGPYGHGSPQWNIACDNLMYCLEGCKNFPPQPYISGGIQVNPAFATINRYSPGTTVLLQLGIWDSLNTQILTQGSVTGVKFYAVSMSDFVTAGIIDSVNWTLIGTGTFNTQNGFWEIGWNIPSYISGQIPAFLLAAEILDPATPGGNYGVFTAAVEATANPNPVPTLTQWGLIILGILLLGVGVVYILRRKKLMNA